MSTTVDVVLPSDQEASGRLLGDEEMLLLGEVIESGTLTSTKGKFVKRLEEAFAAKLGVKHAYACSHGTAALHVAFAAIDPEPGDEIITTSITDMGALTPMLYQGAIPVFADVDPHTYNVTAEAIAARISPRTKAIVVTHLFGNPCDMQPILELAAKHNLPIIEDCAQSFLSQIDGRTVGTMGSIGCFSLQQGKHITTGEGGIVVTNDDALARRMYLYINKAWGYGDPKPDHYFLALNYRMSELLGAVALAQLGKLDYSVQSRIATAEKLTERISGIPGLEVPQSPDGAVHTYWKYCLRVDPQIIAGGTVALSQALKERGIASAPRYIQKPAFRCQVFTEQRTLGNSRFPFNLARPEAVDYRQELFPGTFDSLDHILVLPWNERYTDEHVNYIADAIFEAVEKLGAKS
jgi:dTDP-4-amino-4,6-dideoxygalactose transaminase